MVRLFGFLALSLLVGCQTAPEPESEPDMELQSLADMMVGTFSSTAQAEADTNFFDINLVMHPIWEDADTLKWLYVEQAVSTALDRPYRQRVYRLSKLEDGRIESRVYELPDPERFIAGWDDLTVFDQINADSLSLRAGCAVFLKKDSGGCYVGSTDGKACSSSLRGASYATSEVEICLDKVTSLDRGWDEADEQVWGSEYGAYIFSRN